MAYINYVSGAELRFQLTEICNQKAREVKKTDDWRCLAIEITNKFNPTEFIEQNSEIKSSRDCIIHTEAENLKEIYRSFIESLKIK